MSRIVIDFLKFLISALAYPVGMFIGLWFLFNYGNSEDGVKDGQ